MDQKRGVKEATPKSKKHMERNEQGRSIQCPRSPNAVPWSRVDRRTVGACCNAKWAREHEKKTNTSVAAIPQAANNPVCCQISKRVRNHRANHSKQPLAIVLSAPVGEVTVACVEVPPPSYQTFTVEQTIPIVTSAQPYLRAQLVQSSHPRFLEIRSAAVECALVDVQAERKRRMTPRRQTSGQELIKRRFVEHVGRKLHLGRHLHIREKSAPPISLIQHLVSWGAGGANCRAGLYHRSHCGLGCRRRFRHRLRN